MADEGEILLEDTALIIADAIVSSIPLLNLAWNLSKALLESGMKLRQQRALEWVEMVRDNPTYFTEAVLSDECFQDGFVYMLENYIIERSEHKRKITRNIFLDFAESDNLENFLLEKFSHTLSQLEYKDIEVLKFVNEKWGIAGHDRPSPLKLRGPYQIYDNRDTNVENIHNLINLGILMNDSGARLGPITAPFVNITEFGEKFIGYIT